MDISPVLAIYKVNGDIYIAIVTKEEVLNYIDELLTHNRPIHTIAGSLTPYLPGSPLDKPYVVAMSTQPEGWLMFIKDNQDVTQELLTEGQALHDSRRHNN